MHAWSRPSLGEGLGLLCLGAVPLLALATHSQIILPIAALALLGLGGRAPWPRDPLLVLAGLFCLWAALSLSWTPASGAAAWRPAYTVPLVLLAGVALSRGSLPPLALPTLAVSMLLGARVSHLMIALRSRPRPPCSRLADARCAP
ncbi:hypothetical protein [Pararhodospirillum photometricum]|uniref:hypothetical protein n=1 Tax=Pararhodospirillum photometricum TaxID=1084 RepID=UPI00030D098C|nr:hypothetical protein [Pararhodospirillum photometricum]